MRGGKRSKGRGVSHAPPLVFWSGVQDATKELVSSRITGRMGFLFWLYFVHSVDSSALAFWRTRLGRVVWLTIGLTVAALRGGRFTAPPSARDVGLATGLLGTFVLKEFGRGLDTCPLAFIIDYLVPGVAA